MLVDIVCFLLEVVFTLFGAMLVLRSWVYAVRAHSMNPLVHTIYQITDWFILPLQRLIKPHLLIDWSSLFAAWLSALVYLVLMGLTVRGNLLPNGAILHLMLGALIMLCKWTLNLIVWLTLIQTVVSWVNPMAPIMTFLKTLMAMFLNPIQHFLPNKGLDLSPLILLITAQVLLMVLTRMAYILVSS